MPVDNTSDKSKKRRIEESEESNDEEERTTDDKYHRDTGLDLVIISSDNVKFYVQKFYVQAASAVFRNMIEDCTFDPAEVQLTDDDIEDATIVRLFLDLACGVDLVAFESTDDDDVCSLIDFCKKYDCAAALITIKLSVSRPLIGCAGKYPAHPLRFYHACMLDDIETAHRLLPRVALAPWDKTAFKGPGRGIEDASCLDMTSTAIYWLDRLPRKYFYALLRATRLRMRQPQGTWQEVADDFKEQVRLQEVKEAAEEAVRGSEGLGHEMDRREEAGWWRQRSFGRWEDGGDGVTEDGEG